MEEPGQREIRGELAARVVHRLPGRRVVSWTGHLVAEGITRRCVADLDEISRSAQRIPERSDVMAGDGRGLDRPQQLDPRRNPASPTGLLDLAPPRPGARAAVPSAAAVTVRPKRSSIARAVHAARRRPGTARTGEPCPAAPGPPRCGCGHRRAGSRTTAAHPRHRAWSLTNRSSACQRRCSSRRRRTLVVVAPPPHGRRRCSPLDGLVHRLACGLLRVGEPVQLSRSRLTPGVPPPASLLLDEHHPRVPRSPHLPTTTRHPLMNHQ